MGQVYEELVIARSNVTRRCLSMQKAGGSLIPVAHLVLLVCLMLASFRAVSDENVFSDINYRLGEGLRVADTGLSLGGYATAGYDDLRHSSGRAAIDNMSLFVWWQGEGRWKFFSELDYENERPNRALDTDGQSHYLALERLYLDYALAETTNVRAGKFLTPIGRWNLVHATPLVWTSSRPLITTQAFPTNVTGLMLDGTLPSVASGVEYALYASNGNEFRPNPSVDTFNEVIGAHVSVPMPWKGQIGFSYAAFEQQKTLGENKRLIGVDFAWSQNRYEISSEGVYRFSDKGSSWDEKGAFVQVVAPLSENLYAVGRYEAYRKAQATTSTRLWVAGLNYRITPAIVVKAEWIGSRHNDIGAPEGFMSTVSVLF